jgi:hypothetical protein
LVSPHSLLEQDAAVETDAAVRPIASYKANQVIPGLPDVDLSAFSAELADKAVLEQVIDWAYDAVALRSAYEDPFVHAEDLYECVLLSSPFLSTQSLHDTLTH